MKRKTLMLAWLTVGWLCFPNPGVSGPTGVPGGAMGVELPDGSVVEVRVPGYTKKIQLPGGSPGKMALPKISFEGGKRACVILRGDHDPPVDLGIEILDEEGRLVAKDSGKGDYAAVIWYPPVTGNYTIRFINPQSVFNACYLVIK